MRVAKTFIAIIQCYFRIIMILTDLSVGGGRLAEINKISRVSPTDPGDSRPRASANGGGGDRKNANTANFLIIFAIIPAIAVHAIVLYTKRTRPREDERLCAKVERRAPAIITSESNR